MMNIREIAPVPYAQSPGLAIYCFGKGEPIPYNLFSSLNDHFGAGWCPQT